MTEPTTTTPYIHQAKNDISLCVQLFSKYAVKDEGSVSYIDILCGLCRLTRLQGCTG